MIGTDTPENPFTESFVPLSVPVIRGNEWKYIKECLDTNWVSSAGPFVERFEQEFAKAVGAEYAVACASGTAALHVAMRLAGVSDGGEVLVSTLTFVASVNAVLYERGIPVLVDCEARTWNIDPRLVVDEIERRARLGVALPKAVEVVHILGHPVDIEPIVQVCKRYEIALIEDAAEALGATYATGPLAGLSAGTIGDIGCFSFNGNKIITTGGGGMIVTHDRDQAEQARHLTTQARLPGIQYQHDAVGYNYRLTSIAAALGLAQLEQLPAFLEKKRQIAERYDRALTRLPGVTLPPRESWAASSVWLYSILLDEASFGCDRYGLISALSRAGIESRPLWTPMHSIELFAELPRIRGEVAEGIFERAVSLPSSVSLTTDDQDRVIRVLEECSGL